VNLCQHGGVATRLTVISSADVIDDFAARKARRKSCTANHKELAVQCVDRQGNVNSY